MIQAHEGKQQKYCGSVYKIKVANEHRLRKNVVEICIAKFSIHQPSVFRKQDSSALDPGSPSLRTFKSFDRSYTFSSHHNLMRNNRLINIFRA